METTLTALSMGTQVIDKGINKLDGVHNAGNLKQNVGVLHPIKEPCVILRRKKKFQPPEEEIANLQGLPSNITQRLLYLNGFTRVKDVHVEIDKATEEEKEMIKRQLMEGVIL